MPWFKVDDTLPMHAKIIAAGNAAVGLWVRAGAWSAQQLTDGWVPLNVARMLGSAGEARRLVDVGLWCEKDDGYQFHQWDERQPSRGEVLVRRQQERDRKVEWRRRKAERDAGTDT